MRKFLINPLAQAEQCATSADAEALLKHVTDCFDYLLPAIESKRAELFHDPRHDHRALIKGEPLHKTLGSLSPKHGHDIRSKWFRYVKSRSRKLAANSIDVSQHASGSPPSSGVKGEMDESILAETYLLISLGGLPFFEGTHLTMTSGDVSKEFVNAHCQKAIEGQLPKYKASPKHGKEPYFDHARKENVAAMPLTEDEAQDSLLRAIEEGGDYWSYHPAKKIFLRFKLTGGNVFHGFEVAAGEVPDHLVSQLR